ncbi:agamous-like MADS-box protein AGL29 [Prunus avium]|uniref:Agamous-like MADS-box protein AGL29 n=1 Tax=Prunus avium TaxID=42229 RepID=A0A6P5S8J8_PRUAV|nr:agamous-like MADS-box protein AGL29 [Prunus avium]
MGRRKMNMKATFSKRRKGLFREAANVSSSSGSEMVVIVLSSENKPYVFGNPSVDSVLDRFLSEQDSYDDHEGNQEEDDIDVEKLQVLLDKHKPNKHAGVDELKKYKAYVEGIKKRVERKMDSLGIKLDNSSEIGYAREERDQ